VIYSISVDRPRCDKHRRRRLHRWSQSTACRRKIFLSPQLRMQKWVTWAKPRPFPGWFVIPLARLDIISLCTKFDSSRFSCPEIRMLSQNSKRVTWRNGSEICYLRFPCFHVSWSDEHYAVPSEIIRVMPCFHVQQLRNALTPWIQRRSI